MYRVKHSVVLSQPARYIFIHQKSSFISRMSACSKIQCSGIKSRNTKTLWWYRQTEGQSPASWSSVRSRRELGVPQWRIKEEKLLATFLVKQQCFLQPTAFSPLQLTHLPSCYLKQTKSSLPSTCSCSLLLFPVQPQFLLVIYTIFSCSPTCLTKQISPI